MSQKKIPAAYIRGGTSKGVFFHQKDLPIKRESWDPLFLEVIGSPDPNKRQINGMGGGLSSLNKVIVVRLSGRTDADVEYTFAQISSSQPLVDYSANCGNLSSAVAPFAIDEGIINPHDGNALIRLYNTNTDKIIHAHVPVQNGKTVISGDYSLHGVAGTGACLKLDYLNPGGAGTNGLLPSGRVLDVLEVDGIGSINVSLIDATTPMVFLDAKDLGLFANENPAELDGDTLVKDKLERIRCAGAVKMGMTDRAEKTGMASPRIGICSSPMDFVNLSGNLISKDEQDISTRIISSGDTHRASPLTSAMCLGTACKISGTIPNQLVRPHSGETRIANPSGILSVESEVFVDNDEWKVIRTSSFRTQRRLMEGAILIPKF